MDEWTLCEWEGHAAIWRLSGHAMAFLDGRWIDVCCAEVGNSAKVMTEAAFRAAFAEALPIPGQFDAARKKKLH